MDSAGLVLRWESTDMRLAKSERALGPFAVLVILRE
jgi:hypothetical protein